MEKDEKTIDWITEAETFRACLIHYQNSIDQARGLYDRLKDSGRMINRSNTKKFNDLESELAYTLKFLNGTKGDLVKSIQRLDNLDSMRLKYEKMRSKSEGLELDEIITVYIASTQLGYGLNVSNCNEVVKFYEETGLIDKVPVEARIKNIDESIETNKGGVLFKGPGSDLRFQGKYIIVESEGKINFLSDRDSDLHGSIAESYGFEHEDKTHRILGGGKWILNSFNKEIKIYGTSNDFGMDPRERTIDLLKEAFPEYTIARE